LDAPSFEQWHDLREQKDHHPENCGYDEYPANSDDPVGHFVDDQYGTAGLSGPGNS
jgi:hypothetical protein